MPCIHYGGIFGDDRVYGGYRTWLGDYQVILDGNTSSFSGYADGTDEVFEYVLFNATDLPEGEHHIRITNASNDAKRPALDIEYVCGYL